MSSAKLCDRCGSLYVPKKGDITLDVHIAKGDKKGTWDGWNEVDFCHACSVLLRKFIASAIQQ